MDTLNQALGISLSMCEIECLAIRFCGFNAKHIAEILHISHGTVDLIYENQLLTPWLDLRKSL